MPAYLIAEHKITDPIKFDEYRTKVIAKHGGRYLTYPSTAGLVHKVMWPQVRGRSPGLSDE